MADLGARPRWANGVCSSPMTTSGFFDTSAQHDQLAIRPRERTRRRHTKRVVDRERRPDPDGPIDQRRGDDRTGECHAPLDARLHGGSAARLRAISPVRPADCSARCARSRSRLRTARPGSWTSRKPSTAVSRRTGHWTGLGRGAGDDAVAGGSAGSEQSGHGISVRAVRLPAALPSADLSMQLEMGTGMNWQAF